MIDESLAKLQNSGFESDPTLDDDDNGQLTGPQRFAKGQKAKDEVIIDSQLADIAGQEGYFLKLKKEMRPGLGEWMLMKTIETEWRRWADTETEVARIVKEHTRIAPAKWGTGPYRIEYGCKGGMRGKTYPVKDFWINAEEEMNNVGQVGQPANAQPAVDPTTQVTAQLDMLGRLMDVMKGVQPTPIDPATIQKQSADAFQQGLAAKANEGNQSTALITAMMTGMIGLMTAIATNKPVPVEAKVVNPTEGLTGMLETLKTFGVLGNQEKEKPKSLVDTLGELKLLGLDIFKKDDPLEQISKLKQLASIAGDFMGMGGTGEKPGILEKIVDMVGPSIPGIIKDLKDTAGNAMQAQVEAGKNIERARLPIQSGEGQSMNVLPNTGMDSGVSVNPQITAFFNGLYEAVNANNRLFYPIIYASLLQDPKGVALVNGIVSGSHTAKELIELLQGYGDTRFKDSEFVMKRLVGYTNGFIIWLRDMVKPKNYGEMAHEQEQQEIPLNNGNAIPTISKGVGYEVGCGICHTIYVYESAEEFMQEAEKICGQNGCTGALQSLTKAS